MYRSDEWLVAKLRGALGTQHDVSTIIHWIHAARMQRPVLFVGAGFSRNARSRAKGKEMRAWSELTEALAQDLGDHSPTQGDALWTAERFRRQHSDYELIEKIRWAVPDKDCDPGDEHHALVSIDWHSVLTFNYDTLLERTFSPKRYHRTAVSIVQDEQLVRSTAHESLPIVHLHGHIDFPNTIVLSLDDFRTYAERHPMFLTVARQLLAQHPTLFLGFGATDPNFVAWSGWLADHLGAQTPPWIRLQPVPDPKRWNSDPGFDRYWSPRLRTVGYGTGDGFCRLITLMAEGLSPLDNADTQQYTSDLAEIIGDTAATSASAEDEGSIKLLHQIDENLQQRWFAELSFVGHAEPVQAVLRQLLKSKGLTDEELGTLLGESREWAERQRAACQRAVDDEWEPSGIENDDASEGTSSRMPLEQQRQEIRRTLGEALFAEWLVLAVRHISPMPSVSVDGSHFDAADEYSKLQAKDASKRLKGILLELGLLLADKVLEGQQPSGSPRDYLLSHLKITSEATLDPRRREMFDDAILRWELENGIQNGPIQNGRSTAQATRRRAFLAARSGDDKAARDLYQEAADASRSEGECPWIELMTIEEAEFWMRCVSVNSDAPRLSSDRATLTKRRKELQRLATEQGPILRDRASYRFHFSRVLDTLQCEARDQAYSSLHFRREPLEERLRVTEWHWLYAESRGIADQLTHIYCSESDWESTVRLWRRYGPPSTAVARVRHLVDAPRANPINESLIRLAEEGNVPSTREKSLVCIRALLTPELTLQGGQPLAGSERSEGLVKYVLEEISGARGNDATDAFVTALRHMTWSESETALGHVISRVLETKRPDMLAWRLSNLFSGVFGYTAWHRWLGGEDGDLACKWLVDTSLRCLTLKDGAHAIGALVFALVGDEDPGVQQRISQFVSEIGRDRLIDALKNDVLRVVLDMELSGSNRREHVRHEHHTEMAEKLLRCRDAHKPVSAIAVGAWLRTLPSEAQVDDVTIAEWLRDHLAERVKGWDDGTWTPAHPEASALAEVAAYLSRVHREEHLLTTLDRDLSVGLQIAPDALPAVGLQFGSEWLPSAKHALDWGFKANHVGSTRVDVEDLQSASLSAIFVQLAHGRPVMKSWVVGIAWLSGARSRLVAIQACRFLGRYVRECHERLDGEFRDAIVDALRRALHDGRSAVAAAAVEELELLRCRGLVVDSIPVQVRHDPRRAFRRAFEFLRMHLAPSFGDSQREVDESSRAHHDPAREDGDAVPLAQPVVTT